MLKLCKLPNSKTAQNFTPIVLSYNNAVLIQFCFLNVLPGSKPVKTPLMELKLGIFPFLKGRYLANNIKFRTTFRFKELSLFISLQGKIDVKCLKLC